MNELPTITPNPLQPNGFGGVGPENDTPAPYHTHDGINSPKLDTGPADPTNSVQFNNAGSFGGSSKFTFNGNTVVTAGTAGVNDDFSFDYLGVASLYITSNNDINPWADGDIDIRSDIGNIGGGISLLVTNRTSDGAGGTINLTSGKGHTNGNGGDLTLIANDGGSGGGVGGTTRIYSGSALSGLANAGSIQLIGGGANAGAGTAGSIDSTSGSSIDQNGGNIGGLMGTGNATTGKDGIFYIQGSRNTTAYSRRVCGRILTTNATPTNAHRAVVPQVPTDSTMIIQAKVSARRTSGTAGATGDAAAYIRSACYKNIAGTVTLVGAITDGLTAEDQAGWDCSFAISGTDVFLQVTGATNNNITWNYELFYLITSS